MKITLTSKWLLVTVEEESVYANSLNSFISKNFKDCIKLPKTFIILNKPDNLSKKKQLLLWITNIYKRLNPSVMPTFLKSVIKSYNLTLKIKLETPNKSQISKFTTILLKKVDKNLILFTMQPKSNYIYHFLKIFFRDFELKVVNKNSELLLHITSTNTILKIEELLNRKMILSFRVNFKYDFFVKSLLNRKNSNSNNYYKNNEQENKKSTNNSNILIDIELHKSITILESKKGDKFDVIRKRYLKLAKKYHPDSVFNESNEIIDKYTKKFQDIQEAFSVVKNHYN